MAHSHSGKAAAARSEGSAPGPSQGRRWLNLGVLAHVDAGKTSLTEALLYAGGAVNEVGRVDDGTTQTDSLAMERRRGITIRTAVATFAVDDVSVNLVDTPGHPDFIAEVDRSLAVLDGAVLVVSAVEGVQAQTIVLFRALRRLGVPAVIFINKIDRSGADPDQVLAVVRRRLTAALVPLGAVRGQGTPHAAVDPQPWDDPSGAELVTAQLAEYDDELLRAWVHEGRPASADQLWKVLGQLTRRGTVHPVLFGSARTGAGVPQLVSVLTDLLATEPTDPHAPASGQVFKIERTPAGDRVCSIRMRSGTLAVRDHVHLGHDRRGTVTALEVHEPGGPVSRRDTVAGQIARAHGLPSARIGDWIGALAATAPEPSFPAPTLQTTVVARDPSRSGELHRALSELADVDPLIRLRPDDQRGAVRISVYGEVQQEVIAETLAGEYGVEIDFRATTVICVERPAARASAVRRLGDPGHRYGYTLGVTVEPAPPETGIQLVVTADRLSGDRRPGDDHRQRLPAARSVTCRGPPHHRCRRRRGIEPCWNRGLRTPRPISGRDAGRHGVQRPRPVRPAPSRPRCAPHRRWSHGHHRHCSHRGRCRHPRRTGNRRPRRGGPGVSTSPLHLLTPTLPNTWSHFPHLVTATRQRTAGGVCAWERGGEPLGRPG
jgi:ribosomal protection tetracycline resistance protein